jgi:hypothetical protein
MTFHDRLFNAKMDTSLYDADWNYSRMLFRDALTRGFNRIIDSRDSYFTALK